jgi:signal transduction histidine kinase/ActR/RegA family two-component response regulator
VSTEEAGVVEAAPPLRAVLIDDTPDIRLLLRIALEGSGRFTVVDQAGDGQTGIAVVKAAQPDVVLLDLAMPVLDGLEALPRIRAAAPHARVLVLSGFESATMRHQAHAAGAHAYLQKAMDPRDIADAVLRLVGSPPAAQARVVRPRVLPGAPDAGALLEAAPIGVLTVRTDGAEVISANPAATELVGHTLSGMPLASTCAPLAEALAANLEALRRGLRASTRIRWRGRVLAVTLQAVDPLVAAYLVPAPEGADDADWLRSAVAAAAHEIRNPTVVIAGAAAALTRPGPDLSEDVRADLLAAVSRQVRLLDQATSDLLVAAQAHRGTLRVEPRPTPVAPLLAEVAADTCAEDVAVRCPRDLVALADATRLRQMLLNLLGNALKHGAPPFGLEARAHDGRVRIAVRDAGPGVPGDFVPELFAEFARAPGTAAAGTGLGLFVVRSLAQAQGGDAWYERAAGGGAQFVITVPSPAGEAA